TMTAGHDINLNDFVVTNNGAIKLFAMGTVNFAPGKALFAGSAPITLNAGGDLHTGSMFSSGPLSIQSLNGSVEVHSLMDGHTTPIAITAAGSVDINQPIVDLIPGSDALTVTAGTDINVNATVDGRGGDQGGGIAMNAGRSLNVNNNIVTNNGALSLT